MRWLKRPEPKVHGYRRRKIDMDALARDIEQYPDAYQSERAARFAVHQNAICHALKKLKVSCSIPDDHIASRRSALFMARSVLEAARDVTVSYKKRTAPSQNMRHRTAPLPDDDWTL